ncbi:MAG: DUF2752 domain-containing protein [Saprospiraceae bacterium]|nr:DUF2752 domain-containing protein [Saprospiraceae bacterium]MDW8484618.1 DUF2752 domain-containing protein [Saprospiraceae bacterium]
MARKRFFWWIWLAILVVVPITLLLLPADFFDKGESICPSKRFFDVECLGCGMTRAVMHLLHLDFEMALYYNAGSFIVAPALGFIWLQWLFRTIKALRQ